MQTHLSKGFDHIVHQLFGEINTILFSNSLVLLILFQKISYITKNICQYRLSLYNFTMDSGHLWSDRNRRSAQFQQSGTIVHKLFTKLS